MASPQTFRREYPARVHVKDRPVGEKRPCCQCLRLFQPTTKRTNTCESCFKMNSRMDDGLPAPSLRQTFRHHAGQ